MRLLFMRKYRKRILLAAAAVVFFPALAFLLLWWDSRPKSPADITVTFVKKISIGQTNFAMFAISNRSAFPVSYYLSTETNDWYGHSPLSWSSDRGMISTNGELAPAADLALSTPLPVATNRWRIRINHIDARRAPLEAVRNRLAFLIGRHIELPKVEQLLWVNKAYGSAFGPEMSGFTITAPAN